MLGHGAYGLADAERHDATDQAHEARAKAGRHAGAERVRRDATDTACDAAGGPQAGLSCTGNHSTRRAAGGRLATASGLLCGRHDRMTGDV